MHWTITSEVSHGRVTDRSTHSSLRSDFLFERVDKIGFFACVGKWNSVLQEQATECQPNVLSSYASSKARYEPQLSDL